MIDDDPELDLERARMAAVLHLELTLRAVKEAEADLRDALDGIDEAIRAASDARDALDELTDLAESACRIVAGDGDPFATTAPRREIRDWRDRMPVI